MYDFWRTDTVQLANAIQSTEVSLVKKNENLFNGHPPLCSNWFDYAWDSLKL